MMDVELQMPPGSPQYEAPRSAIFPIDLTRCCPPLVRTLVPTTWLKYQDGTHLTLALGVFAGIALVIKTVINVMHGGHTSWWSLVRQIICCVFILPILSYFVKIIEQYDDRLQSKQKDAWAKKESLTKSYNDLLRDMDGLLTKSAESSYGLAERSFESKRRDFQRFLERARTRYLNVYSGSKGETDQLLKQFRQFCVNWLTVFEECSIDPIACPKRVVAVEELNRCTTVVEICDLCLERLRVTEVRFISIQRDQDAQLLRKNRNEFRRITGGGEHRGTTASNAHDARTFPEIISVTSAAGVGCTWLVVGWGFGCGLSSGVGEDRYPKELYFFCGRLILLSREHVRLLVGFFVVVLLILLEVLGTMILDGGEDNSVDKAADLGIVILMEVAIIMTLIKFEEIDVIQQLEREVMELTKNTAQVEQQRERMGEFWSNAQQLTDLWLYRTVPRLDLYKELHSQLEDTSPEELVDKFTVANRHLEDLEDHLGALAAWRSGGVLRVDTKKQFGKAINQLCQEQEFHVVMRKLEDVTKNSAQSIKDARPMITSTLSSGSAGMGRVPSGTPMMQPQRSVFSVP
eukprot:TRINITY_DN33585_c0_g1_i1.p1 TRINITY_DN33585_c0_g1~~TRINITY_DN33585_c0_g1_i1.p1  ORF type:complete len:575 (+),score=136.20 TRINITY_DN33585_c0_g1_i1:202-1926(+)